MFTKEQLVCMFLAIASMERQVEGHHVPIVQETKADIIQALIEQGVTLDELPALIEAILGDASLIL